MGWALHVPVVQLILSPLISLPPKVKLSKVTISLIVLMQREQELLAAPSPIFATPPTSRPEDNGSTPWYGFRATASPRPYPVDAESVTESMASPPVQTVPLVAMEDADNSVSYERLTALLNADGELLDPAARLDIGGEMDFSTLPDNDKAGSEPAMFPGR